MFSIISQYSVDSDHTCYCKIVKRFHFCGMYALHEFAKCHWIESRLTVLPRSISPFPTHYRKHSYVWTSVILWLRKILLIWFYNYLMPRHCWLFFYRRLPRHLTHPFYAQLHDNSKSRLLILDTFQKFCLPIYEIWACSHIETLGHH